MYMYYIILLLNKMTTLFVEPGGALLEIPKLHNLDFSRKWRDTI